MRNPALGPPAFAGKVRLADAWEAAPVAAMMGGLPIRSAAAVFDRLALKHGSLERERAMLWAALIGGLLVGLLIMVAGWMLVRRLDEDHERDRKNGPEHRP